MTPVERLEKYIRVRYDVGQSFDNLVTSLKEEEKKSSPQDTPAICTYSGLRSISGYTKEEENTEEYKAYRRGWLAGYDEGLYDKNIK
jgi:hypothetical protein